MHCCRKKSENGGKAPKSRRRSRTLFFGMLVGLGLGLLFAPKPGSETLNDLKELLGSKMPI